MNDEFLYRFREAPRAEFAEALYRRISREPHAPARLPLRLPLAHRWAWGLATVVLVSGLILFSSPTARAAVLEAIERIGLFVFEETDKYPYTDLPVYHNESLSLSEDRDRIPFAFRLPAWAPEGFVLNDRARAILPTSDPDLSRATNVYVTWTNPDGAKIILVAQPGSLASCTDCAVPVGTGSLEETEVNGNPAALVRGSWDDRTQSWDTSNGIINLRWSQEQSLYLLTGIEPSVSVADLIRMAESLE